MAQFPRAFRGKLARFLFPERYALDELKCRGVTLKQLVKMAEEQNNNADNTVALQQKLSDLDAMFKEAGLSDWKSTDFAEDLKGLEGVAGVCAHATPKFLTTETIQALLSVEEGGGAEVKFCRGLLVVLSQLGETFGESLEGKRWWCVSVCFFFKIERLSKFFSKKRV